MARRGIVSAKRARMAVRPADRRALPDRPAPGQGTLARRLYRLGYVAGLSGQACTGPDAASSPDYRRGFYTGRIHHLASLANLPTGSTVGGLASYPSNVQQTPSESCAAGPKGRLPTHAKPCDRFGASGDKWEAKSGKAPVSEIPKRGDTRAQSLSTVDSK